MAEEAPSRGHAPRDGRLGEPVGAHRGDPALEVLETRSRDASLEEAVERREVAAVCVERPRRAARRQGEEEAFDVGVDGGHGAEPDSAAGGRLLSRDIVRCLRRRLVVPIAVLLAFAGSAVLPARAHASQLLDRGTSHERLAVSGSGVALATYRTSRGVRHVLAWGAVDARTPSQERGQVQFRVDYSGGWGSFHRPVWKTPRNTCRRYTGRAFRTSSRRAPPRTGRTGRSSAGSASARTSPSAPRGPRTTPGSSASLTGRARSRGSKSGRTGATAAASGISSGD